MGSFREAYGFVASDDVQRAVGLMMHNAMRDVGSTNDFIGQLGPTEYILVTQPASLNPLTDRIRKRLDQTLDFFYPLQDRSLQTPRGDRLGVRMGHLAANEGPYRSLEDLKLKLAHQLV